MKYKDITYEQVEECIKALPIIETLKFKVEALEKLIQIKSDRIKSLEETVGNLLKGNY